MKKTDIKKDDDEDKYYVMDNQLNEKICNDTNDKFKTHIYRIGVAKQRIIKALKIEFERNQGAENMLQLARF